jgi:isopentenyl diphosphate isomerase/L-lactate dehydrogenase-like FMN-dependent dehydrogenase
MNVHKIAENLFKRAESLGLDAPTEDMVAECLGEFEANLYNEIDYELTSNGMHDASKHIQNLLDLAQR